MPLTLHVLSSLRELFDRLLSDCPAYGYFSKPSKTVLVAQPSNLQKVDALFHDLGVSVVAGVLYASASSHNSYLIYHYKACLHRIT